jgi:hypothetical protein
MGEDCVGSQGPQQIVALEKKKKNKNAVAGTIETWITV